jgi:hypothetical protein
MEGAALVLSIFAILISLGTAANERKSREHLGRKLVEGTTSTIALCGAYSKHEDRIKELESTSARYGGLTQ